MKNITSDKVCVSALLEK